MASRDADLVNRYFTDFEGRFRARLSAIYPGRPREAWRESEAVRAAHTCIVKAEYHKDLMALLEEGMLLAVRNYKAIRERSHRYTLLEIVSVRPSHFGLSGLGDQSYYPLQFEIIEQSVADWESSDTSTMMIRVTSIPINYDLILHPDRQPSFERGFSYPIPAERAHILNSELINLMCNQRIIERLRVPERTTAEARKDPRLGILRMFQSARQEIPLYVDFERLVRYHFGIFAFTGGGKSNLLSNIIRRLLYHTRHTKIVIFDVACEYPFLLLDVLADPKIPAHIILDHPITDPDQLAASIVRPREYEEDPRVPKALAALLRRGIVGHLARRFIPQVYTYSRIISELEELANQSVGRPTYVNAIDLIQSQVASYMASRNLGEEDPVDSDFAQFLDTVARDAVDRFGVSDKSQLYAWATSRPQALQLQSGEGDEAPAPQKESGAKQASTPLTEEQILDLVEGEDRLFCLSLADPATIKQLVIKLTGQLLRRRKQRFQVRPYILFVFDEAQEFIPQKASGLDQDCNRQVERLLRQGRKYGLGACIATQRVAHLNTSALQQLHTFFVGTLPRPYDRSVVSSTFLVDHGILERTLEFAPGEWLLASYIATGMENVPLFLRADNAELEVERHLSTIKPD